MKTLTIERLSHDLRGVAYSEGNTWFVEGVLPGEVIEAEALLRRQQTVDARVVRVNVPAVERVAPFCQYESQCGGCGMQHIDHTAQVRFKQQVLLDQLARIGKVQPDTLSPPLVSEPRSYRRRARIACKWLSDKKHLAVGFRERHSQAIVEIDHCPVLVSGLDALLPPLRACLSLWSQPRQLGHIELLAADNGVGVLLRVMTMPVSHDAALLQAFAASNAVTVYLQCGEQGAVEYYCGDKKDLVSAHIASNSSLVCMPGDFLQGNALVNDHLIDAVLVALQPEKDDVLLEAFCGLGNFTFPLSKKAGHITAVELSEAMLLRAKEQSSASGIGNINWLSGNLDRLDECRWTLPDYNKILLDPPRDGAQDFCKKISLKGVERIVYVSCNPSTLARDATILAERGFALRSVQLVDMFPQTSHIEALSVFQWDESLLRKAKKQKVAAEKSVQKRLKR